MNGVTDLATLLRSMDPALVEGEFVYGSLTEKRLSRLRLEPLLTFRESEGITVVVRREEADERRLDYSGVWSLVSLGVHSDLGAVGLLAAIASKLAEAGIPVNVVSAYFHDHLLVPRDRAREALGLLRDLSRDS